MKWIRTMVTGAISVALVGCVSSETWRKGAVSEDGTVSSVGSVVEYRMSLDNNGKVHIGNNSYPHRERAITEVFKDSANGEELVEINFVEFTERGNIEHSGRRQFVLDRVGEQLKSPGTVVVLFVHGWNNNASVDNNNVHSFRQALGELAYSLRMGSQSQRKVVGVYLGWRGQVYLSKLVNTALTFWDRKSVAQEIGDGSVTRFLLELEQLKKGGSKQSYFVAVGHSFGAALLFRAYDEVLLEKIELIARQDYQERGVDQVFLLNPAIEANEILPVKEAVAKHRPIWGSSGTPALLEVISSVGDCATHVAFPIGQTLDFLAWKRMTLFRPELGRRGANSQISLHESDLMNTAMGNFSPFHTKEIWFEGDKKTKFKLFTCWSRTPENDMHRPDQEPRVSSLCGNEAAITRRVGNSDGRPLPCSESDPVQFTYTSKTFIESHGDVFNKSLRKYLVSLVTREANSSIRQGEK